MYTVPDRDIIGTPGGTNTGADEDLIDSHLQCPCDPVESNHIHAGPIAGLQAVEIALLYAGFRGELCLVEPALLAQIAYDRTNRHSRGPPCPYYTTFYTVWNTLNLKIRDSPALWG